MAGEYLICTDQAGVKSYLPLDTTYMKKVKGGYTINLNATKTVKIKIKNASSTSSYTDVDAADAKAVAWVVKNKIMEPTSKNEFYSKAICTKGDVFNALYKANGSPTPKALNYFPDVRGDLENLWRRICWQHITIRASIRRGCLILCRLQRQRLIRNTGINMMC